MTPPTRPTAHRSARPAVPPFRALAAIAIAALLAAAVLSGCGAPAPASFDPAQPCTQDYQGAGAYPELEAIVPPSWDGQPAGELNSGRTCQPGSLGSLLDHGIHELRFAGATWRFADGVGMTIAVFEGEGLDTARIMEFYRKGAKEAGRTDQSSQTDITVGTTPALRFDATDPDGKRLLVVTWATATEGRVHVLLGAGLDDELVADILAKLGQRAGG